MMNQGDIFKKIGQILNELQDQYEFLAHNPEQLNELELELFLANANFLSDHVQIVRKLNSSNPVKELPQHTQETISEKSPPAEPETLSEPEPTEETQEIKHNTPVFEFILDSSTSNDKFEFEEKSVESIFDRPLSKEEERIIAEKQKLMESQSVVKEASKQIENEPTLEHSFLTEGIEEATVEEEPAPQSQPAPVIQSTPEFESIPEPIVYKQEVINEIKEDVEIPKPDTNPIPEPELFKTPEPPKAVEYKIPDPVKPEPLSNPRPTLNDILAGKGSSLINLNAESSKPPITDLKKAITLNEKLLYIKDLFNGYNLAYSEAIDLINKMPDLKTADAFLKNNYAEKNNWASKQGTVDKFYELLNQRFS